jgi:hypothetical protein
VRLDCVRLRGAFVRMSTPGKRMVSVGSHSGAEAAAVRMHRDQRMLQSSFDFEYTPQANARILIRPERSRQADGHELAIADVLQFDR